MATTRNHKGYQGFKLSPGLDSISDVSSDAGSELEMGASHGHGGDVATHHTAGPRRPLEPSSVTLADTVISSEEVSSSSSFVSYNGFTGKGGSDTGSHGAAVLGRDEEVLPQAWTPPDDANKYNNIALLEKMFFVPGLFYLSYASAYIITAASLPFKPLLEDTNALRANTRTYYEIAPISIALQTVLFLCLWAKYGNKYLQNFQNVGNVVFAVAVACHLLPRLVYFCAPYSAYFNYTNVPHAIENKISTSIAYLTVLFMEFSLFYFDYMELIVNQRWLFVSFVLDILVCNGAMTEYYVDFKYYNYLSPLAVFVVNLGAAYWQAYPFVRWLSVLWNPQFRERVCSTYDRRSVVFISAISFSNAFFIVSVQLFVRVYTVSVAVSTLDDPDPYGPVLKEAIVFAARFGYHLLFSLYGLLGIVQVINNIPS